MKRIIESNALLVRSVPYGESDLVATFFTQTDGKLTAIVRGARRSTKRFGGALEPLHELVLVIEDKGREVCLLKEARIGRPRQGLTSDLDAMEAAGRALRWIRHLCPSRTPEPSAWTSLAELLDELDRHPHAGDRRLPLAQHLAVFGLGLLADMGYALDFERCVRCGKPCPEGRAAFIDAAGGGLVCMACGGARRTIDADLRALAIRAQARDPSQHLTSLVLTSEQANELLTIVEEAMSAHTDFDPNARSD